LSEKIGKLTSGTLLAVVFAAGILAHQLYLYLGGSVVKDRQELDLMKSRLENLEAENDQLFDELFSPRATMKSPSDTAALPFDSTANASAAVAAARARAVEEGKFLMITFGANWCPDSRNLVRQLHSDTVFDYVHDRFLFVNVDVGKFNRNTDLAADLGVSFTRGIPVAVFFDPQGRVIGATNEGELELARHFTAHQILKFLRDVAERSRILAPDAVR
jgi:thiol:disulfide interchange protein